MKIFFPLEVFYPSQAGGPANSIYWLTKNLSDFDIESIIVTTDKGLQEDVAVNKWVNLDFGKAIYVKTLRYNFPLRQTFVSLANFKNSDVVHISSIFFPSAFITAFAARLLKMKIVISPRGELDKDALEHSKFKKKPILWLIKKFINSYPIFHSTCNEESQYIKDIFGENVKIQQIPNFIELPNEVKRKDSKYILFIGRFHPKKAIDNLIKAISICQPFIESEFVLKIAGTGKPEFESKLRKLVHDLDLENKVKFVGQVEGIDKQKLYADAYFTIMPSHTENFGNVVLESLCQSTPVIASYGTPWKVLEEEKIGFWIDNSPKNIAKTLETILNLDSLEYKKMRCRSRKFVKANFDVKTNIHKWVEVYKNLL